MSGVAPDEKWFEPSKWSSSCKSQCQTDNLALTSGLYQGCKREVKRLGGLPSVQTDRISSLTVSCSFLRTCDRTLAHDRTGILQAAFRVIGLFSSFNRERRPSGWLILS